MIGTIFNKNNEQSNPIRGAYFNLFHGFSVNVNMMLINNMVNHLHWHLFMRPDTSKYSIKGWKLFFVAEEKNKSKQVALWEGRNLLHPSPALVDSLPHVIFSYLFFSYQQSDVCSVLLLSIPENLTNGRSRGWIGAIWIIWFITWSMMR